MFGVLSTGSGAEAITLAARSEPDLIMLDLRLPDVSGEDPAGWRITDDVQAVEFPLGWYGSALRRPAPRLDNGEPAGAHG